MRKVTTPAKVCEDCGSRLTAEKYESFCDHCGAKIDLVEQVHTTVFYKASATRPMDREFCSWKCFIEWIVDLPFNVRRVEFISLPILGGSDRSFSASHKLFVNAITTVVQGE
jgi:hypothetical protein